MCSLLIQWPGWVYWRFLADVGLICARRSPLRLIYARPCNWLVIPQLGYTSISILCNTLLNYYLLCSCGAQLYQLFKTSSRYIVTIPGEVFLPGPTILWQRIYSTWTKAFLWTKTYHLYPNYRDTCNFSFCLSFVHMNQCVWESSFIERKATSVW